MKTCPNCEEFLGDSVKVCIKCRYDFARGRVITNDELIEKRNKQIEQQQKAIEEAKAKEEQRSIQISKNPLFEYQVIVVDDMPNGQVDDKSLQKALNEWSEKGWKLHTIFTNEIGKTSNSVSVGAFGSGINATIEQTVLVFERCVKA